MIRVLWRAFFDICCFHKGPQDLPASTAFLSLTLLVYAACSSLQVLSTQTPAVALAAGLIDAVLLALLCYFVLFVFRKTGRWLQATTALAGTGIIFNIATIPLSYILTTMDKQDPMITLLFLFVISLLVWNIGVMAHIMRNALSSSLASGVLVALFYFLVIMLGVASLFPQLA